MGLWAQESSQHVREGRKTLADHKGFIRALRAASRGKSFEAAFRKTARRMKRRNGKRLA